MHIIIIGGGKVGETLLDHLSNEGNDITLIDSNERVVETLMGSYDILGLTGSGTDYETLMSANIPMADMVLSVTTSDEINIIAALMAKQMGAKFTIARVRNPQYSEHLEFMIEKMGIDMVMNPDQAAAQDVARILKFPHALDVESFSAGKVNLVCIQVEKGSPLHDKTLAELRGVGMTVLVCIVARGEEVYIPRGDFRLYEGDQIYVTGTSKDLMKFSKYLGYDKERIRDVFIVGGGRLAYYLTRRLIKAGKHVKIVELDHDRCMQLALAYPEAVIIEGDGTDQALLEAEGIGNYDATIALTGIDEENILISMFAASQHVQRTITKVNRTNLMKLLQNVGLQTVITPRNLMANIIVRAVRAKQNIAGSEILTLYKMMNNRAEVVEFKINDSPQITGIPLKDMPIQSNALLVYIIRNKAVLFPHGETKLAAGDHVILVTTEIGVSRFSDVLV